MPLSIDWKNLGTGGGVESFVKMFLAHSEDTNLRVTVLSPGNQEEVQGSVHFVPVMPKASTELAFTRHLRRMLVRHSVSLPDAGVVLANAEHYAWAFRRTGKQIVLVSHGALPLTLRMRHNRVFVRLFRFFIEGYAVRHASSIVTVNRSIKDYYLSRYRRLDPARIVEIPIGIDLNEIDRRPAGKFAETVKIGSEARIVLFVGRLYPEKNLGLFIAACDILREKGEAFEALVIGDGIQASELQDAMTVRPWLHWIPQVPHPLVLDAIARSRVLAICSKYESGPLTLLEAIGLGTPVVSTDVGRARELVVPEIGRIVDGDPVSFARGIQEAFRLESEEVKNACDRLRARIDFNETMSALVALTIRVGLGSGFS